MTSGENNPGYVDCTMELMSILSRNGGKEALGKYLDVMKGRAWMTARDMVSAGDKPEGVLRALIGQLSICIEQADAAKAALEEAEGKASPEATEGIPQW